MENLINLPYLHEPAILFCLQERYTSGDIYTYTGPILIALNPFKSLPLYSSETLEGYYNHGLLKSQGIELGAPLAPHVFAIADASYREMMRLMHGQGFARFSSSSNGSSVSMVSADQSILISGESGAGKTESTKIVLRYLTSVGSSQAQEKEKGSVMDKVLQSNPILEAFGNARTLRNDNSSRFGKFIELQFSKRGHLIGGSIRTYLLEKVRLPLQQRGERSFHIFYQLFAGSTVEQRCGWQIGEVHQYRYTNGGGIYKLQHMDDQKEFLELQDALNILNFDGGDQVALFNAVAGILHLGQVDFTSTSDGEGEGSEVAKAEESVRSLQAFSSMCGLVVSDVASTLTARTIVARGESYTKKLNKIQASDARDALSKAIYGRLFDWIVSTINVCMAVDQTNVRASIGVLDIFGFESFLVNSFEQLCINYTNETLQQQFNQYVFKMEQAEYEREKIDWRFVAFPDNKDTLDLIEHRTSGILAMIEDECRLPMASDEKLAGRMYKAYATHSRFAASAAQKRDSKFCVLHYAGPVEYSTLKFVDKSKDELPREATSLMMGSSVRLMAQLFAPIAVVEGDEGETVGGIRGPQGSPVKKGGKHRSSSLKPSQASAPSLNVGIQFKEQLGKLMDCIYATTPHYIRCLKPNDRNLPDQFSRVRVTEQLRYGGVLEAVRVARSGFPVRLVHAEFFARYRLILSRQRQSGGATGLPLHLPKGEAGSKKAKELCESLVQLFWDGLLQGAGGAQVSKESVQLGLTKVFLRKDAHDLLERHRSALLVSNAIVLQSVMRAFGSRRRFLILKMATRIIQRMTRGLAARKKVTAMRRVRACTIIQRRVRGYLSRVRYVAMCRAALLMQCAVRRHAARLRYHSLRQNYMSCLVCSVLRAAIARKKYLQFRKAISSLQRQYLSAKAKQLLKKLKVEAKDLGRLQQNNDLLKKEIEELKLRALEEKERLRRDLERSVREEAQVAQQAELLMLRRQCEELLCSVDSERQARHAAEAQVSVLQRSLQEDRGASQHCENCDQLMLTLERRDAQHAAELQSAHAELRRLREKDRKAVTTSSSAPVVTTPTPAPLSPSLSTPPSTSSSSAAILVEAQSFSPSKGVPMRPPLTASRRKSYTEVEGRGKEGVAKILPVSTAPDMGQAMLESEISRLRRLSLEQQAIIEQFQKERGSSRSIGARTISTSKSAKVVSMANPAHGGLNPGKAPNSQPPSHPSASSASTRKEGEEGKDWSSAWDEEEGGEPSEGVEAGEGEVSSDASGASAGNALRGNEVPVPSSSPASSLVDTVRTFERNLGVWRQEFQQGVRTRVWEGQRVANQEALVRLDESGSLLHFDASVRRGFGFFQSRVEIPHLALADITEVLPGAEVKAEATDQNVFLSLVCNGSEGSRILALKLTSREERNSFLSRLRAILSAVQIRDGNSPKNARRASTKPSLSLRAEDAVAAPPGPELAPIGGDTMMQQNPMMQKTKPRRMSVRETVLEENLSQQRRVSFVAQISPTQNPLSREKGAAHKPGPGDKQQSTAASSKASEVHFSIFPTYLVHMYLCDCFYVITVQDTSALVKELRQVLSEEKEKHDRLKMQLMMMSNEIVEKDQQIQALQRSEKVFELKLQEREQLYKQDNIVRLQLGKRLEQVLMDKEEALEQLDMLKMQLESLKTNLDSVSRPR